MTNPGLASTIPPKRWNGFSSTQLKWIAIFCMLADHIAWMFVPIDTAAAQIMHSIGRLTAPIMCFSVAEGFFHTRNINRYTTRLFIFAIASWIPFSLFLTKGKMLFYPNFGMIFTLFLGLVALRVCKCRANAFAKAAGVLGLCFLSSFGDWPIFGVLFVLAFGLFREDFTKQAIVFSVVSVLMVLTTVLQMPSNTGVYHLYNAAVLLALPLLYFYNGRRGGENHHKFNKWAFYVFYPTHLLALVLVLRLFF